MLEQVLDFGQRTFEITGQGLVARVQVGVLGVLSIGRELEVRLQLVEDGLRLAPGSSCIEFDGPVELALEKLRRHSLFRLGAGEGYEEREERRGDRTPGHLSRPWPRLHSQDRQGNQVSAKGIRAFDVFGDRPIRWSANRSEIRRCPRSEFPLTTHPIRLGAGHTPAQGAFKGYGQGNGGWARNRTEVRGFAVRCITTLPPSLGAGREFTT